MVLKLSCFVIRNIFLQIIALLFSKLKSQPAKFCHNLFTILCVPELKWHKKDIEVMLFLHRNYKIRK